MFPSVRCVNPLNSPAIRDILIERVNNNVRGGYFSRQQFQECAVYNKRALKFGISEIYTFIRNSECCMRCLILKTGRNSVEYKATYIIHIPQCPRIPESFTHPDSPLSPPKTHHSAPHTGIRRIQLGAVINN
mgnify:FL=1